jgi:hypothetical protein
MAGLKLKYPPERMFKWVKFWDEQMYKSLEAGYQMGLESLNESLADIKVSLQSQLCSTSLCPKRAAAAYSSTLMCIKYCYKQQ